MKKNLLSDSTIHFLYDFVVYACFSHAFCIIYAIKNVCEIKTAIKNTLLQSITCSLQRDDLC